MQENHPASDVQLMSAVADGDKAAYRTLIKRHMSSLMGVAYRMGFHASDAEDIVQDTLLRVWQKAHTWKEQEKSSVKGWMTTIAYNLCIDRKRKISRSKEQEGLDLNLIAGSMNVEQAVSKKQTMRTVMQALKKLPERQRAALILCHYQGFTQAEAAHIIGTSVKGIEGLLVRGRGAMKTALAKHKESLS